LAPDVPVNLLAQSDGKLIIDGAFSTVAGVPRPGLARLNIDGTLDSSFDPGTGPSGGSITAAAVMSNGELLVAGTFAGFDGSARDGVALLYGSDPIPQFVAPTLIDGSMRLSIRTRPGKLYHLEATDSLAPAVWRTIQTLSGDGSIWSIQ